jgi:hypothetical protein
MTVDRVDPSFANDEVGMLREFLDYYRATIRRQASGLTEEQLRHQLPPSDLTLGGMLKHLAFVEAWWFRHHLASRALLAPWDDVDWDADEDWDWHSAAEQTHAELDALLVEAIADSDRLLDEALARGGPEQQALRERKGGGDTVTLRWILVHMVEEYARHAGHADLIRQSIDGATDV